MKINNEMTQQVRKLEERIQAADAILIGAGSGLSASAGLTYSGERFEQHFADFIAKYHFSDMYSATFYPYDSLEEYWAYMSRHIYWNRYAQPVGKPYHGLLKLIEGKDAFVLTTNVDHCFQKAGFDKARLFYTQGDYGLWQCSVPCHEKTYDNEEAVRRMVAEQKDLRIPSGLVPHCPKCGKPMSMNLHVDSTFVQDEGWEKAAERYTAFVKKHLMANILYLELGVGGNTPGIIKYPFQRYTKENSKATYASLNLGEATCPRVIAGQSICIDADIGEVITEMQGDLSQAV